MLLTRQDKSLVFNTLCLACRAGGSLALSPGQRAGLREVKMLELQIRQRQRIDKNLSFDLEAKGGDGELDVGACPRQHHPLSQHSLLVTMVMVKVTGW